MKDSPNEDAAKTKLQRARIARMATVDAAGRPAIIPICFVYDGTNIYTAIDLKPKRVSPLKLARVKNIEKNPEVVLIVDQYLEDWSRLWYVLVRGRAVVLQNDGSERAQAIRLLRQKYRQYRKGFLSDTAPVIRISPDRIKGWGNLS